jgi:hypothetical protein
MVGLLQGLVDADGMDTGRRNVGRPIITIAMFP